LEQPELEKVLISSFITILPGSLFTQRNFTNLGQTNQQSHATVVDGDAGGGAVFVGKCLGS
jgi:hypothetical protein